MKVNNIFKSMALVLTTMMLATSCIQDVEQMTGAATKEQVGESPFAADGMIASIPTILITNNVYGADIQSDFGYPSILIEFDHAIGEILPSNYYSGGNPGYDWFQQYQYQIGIGPNGYCAFVWYHYYKFLKATNDLIAVCGDNDVLKHQRGIAKTFRALYYLDLARFYDPLYAESTERPEYQASLAAIEGLTVPIIDENTTEDMARNNPRVPREEIFQFIFNDLNDAEYCLEDYTQSVKNLPSLAVVYGLKARAYLWLGGFEEGKYDLAKYPNVLTGNAAYQKAAEYARKAITTSGCQPLTEAEYCNPLTGFCKVNNAWMWGMLQSSETILGNMHSWTAHMCINAGWGYGGAAQPGVRKATYERMSNSDFRKKIIVGPNTTYDDYKDVTCITKDEWATFGYEGLGIHPYAHMKFRSNGEKVAALVGNVVDIPMMRVEEMYLIEAEATAHYDEATGKQLITSFMTTAAQRDPNYKVPPGLTGDTLIDEIIFQKRCELWGEGVLFFDFKRLDMGLDNGYEGTNAPPGTDFETKGRCPAWNVCIPESEVQQNAALAGKNNPDPSKTLKSKSDN